MTKTKLDKLKKIDTNFRFLEKQKMFVSPDSVDLINHAKEAKRLLFYIGAELRFNVDLQSEHDLIKVIIKE